MPRTKQRKPEIHKPTTKDILLSLETEYQWLELLADKPYCVLFDIIEKEATKDESDYSPSPSIKQIAEAIDQKPATVTKWLNKIYTDIWELNEVNPNIFKRDGNRYRFHFQDSSTKQSASFNLWSTGHFNKNDKFEWYFMKGVLQYYYFYISDITHERKNSNFITEIYLKTGFPNEYRDHLLSKALFLNMLEFSDYIHLSDYELDDILRSKIENDRPYTPPDNGRRRFNRF